MKRSEISQLSFGKSVAEYEGVELHDYFLPTQAYRNATSEYNRKTFYVGHRGSGKSAIFSQLSDYYRNLGKNNIILEIKPAEYSYETFKSLRHDFYNIRTAYGVAWELTIYIQIFKCIVEFFESKRNIKSNQKNVENIRKYLIKESYLESDNNQTYGIGVLIDFLRKLTHARDSINISNASSGAKRFINILNKDNLKAPINSLKQILASYQIYIFIDELDKGWNNSEEAKNFINGLFVAVGELEKINSLNVFFSIREDMYRNLSSAFDDTEKIRGNIERILWRDIDLKKIIDKRLQAALEREGLLPDGIPLIGINVQIFEEGALQYIINKTLKRPREIIHFCNLALEELKRQSDNSVQESKITIQIVKEVEGEFSEGRLDDFIEEYKFEYPNLELLICFFENGNEYYEIGEFLALLDQAVLKFLEKFPKTSWLENMVDDLDTYKLAFMLYRIGFIKLFLDSKNDYYATYEINIRNIQSIKKLKINDVFCPALKSCKNLNSK